MKDRCRDFFVRKYERESSKLRTESLFLPMTVSGSRSLAFSRSVWERELVANVGGISGFRTTTIAGGQHAPEGNRGANAAKMLKFRKI